MRIRGDIYPKMILLERRRGEPIAELGLGSIYLHCGELEKAEDYFPDALSATKESDNLYLYQNGIAYWSWLKISKGKLHEAYSLLEEGLRVNRL